MNRLVRFYRTFVGRAAECIVAACLLFELPSHSFQGCFALLNTPAYAIESARLPGRAEFLYKSYIALVVK